MKTRLLFALGGFLSGIALFILVSSGCAAQTAPYKNPEWQKNGVASLETIRFGGIDHAVLIRGTNLSHPLLIVLHGFAVPMMPFAHLGYADEGGKGEQNFIVVQYDQRGTGKTARLSNPEPASYNVDQYVRDAEELIEILRRRYNKDKVYVQGISWGSVIGARLAQKRPDLIHAFISEGQVSNMVEAHSAAYALALSFAEEEKNEKALEELRGVTVPSLSRSDEENFQSIGVIGKWLDYTYQKKYGLMDLPGVFFKSLWAAPEYTLPEALSTLSSIETFSRQMNRPILEVDLERQVPELKVPVYMIMGEYDAMNKPARRYFDSLRASRKEWIEIKGAGHAVSADKPAEVDAVYLDKIVRP
jgi:pimeloyl-ACP methyl ester carboxylesterase